MELSKAIFSVHSKKQDLFVSAFKYKVVFGFLKDTLSYEEETSFQFEFSSYHKIYIGFFPIIKCISKKSNVKDGVLIQKENYCYRWMINEGSSSITIHLSIQRTNKNSRNESQLTLNLTLSLEEFNNLVFLISNMCLISLDLSYENFTIFETFSSFETDRILSCQNKDNLKQELANLTHPKITDVKLFIACELVFYNLDIIFCVHRLRSFVNEELLFSNLNIKQMLDCET